MKMRSVSIVLLASLPALAQGQSEAVGPVRGENVGNYNVVQSWEFGYRLADIGGDRGKYRSDVNYRNGFSLLGSSFTMNSREGHGRWFDELSLTSQGLGNDPYQSAALRLQKNRLYRYDLLWRQNDYYNPGFIVADNNGHFENTTHRWQDHDLTLFPQGSFRLRAGYSRVKQTGPALTTVQEFDSRGFVAGVFRNVRQQFDDYRVGGDVQLKGFRLTVQRRWEFFKEDSEDQFRASDFTLPVTPAVLLPSLSNFRRSQPYRGTASSWFGNLFGEFRLLAVNAHATYTGGRGDFAQNELASGIGTGGVTAQRVIAVTGNGDRPVLTGDFNFTLFPASRFSLINNTSGANVRTVGTNNYTQFDLGTFSFASQNFQSLAIRLVTNATDARFRFSKGFDVFGGFRYSDRLIRSVEDQADPGSPLDGVTAQQTNITRAGIAGFNWLPMKNLRAHLEGELGRNDNPFTPVSLRDYHAIRAKVQYRTRKATASGSYQDNNNQNSTSFTAYSSRSRSYSGDFSWTARNWVSVDAGYSKLHLDTIGGIAYFAGAPRPALINGQRSIYTSNIHSANLGLRFAVTPRADLFTGYSLTKDTGDGRGATTTDAFYNAQAFPLTYQTPLARLSVRLHEKLRFNLGYQYYGYREKFGQFQTRQNYRANTGYTSLLWSF